MAGRCDAVPERIERERDRHEDHDRGGRQPGRVQQHQGKEQREPGARPGGVLIGGDLAPEAVHHLDGDTRQQDQPGCAIGLGRPDRRHDGDRRQQSSEARQGRGPNECESAGGHGAVIRSNGRLVCPRSPGLGARGSGLGRAGDSQRQPAAWTSPRLVVAPRTEPNPESRAPSPDTNLECGFRCINTCYVERLGRRQAASRGTQSVGANPERRPDEDFQPRARQLTPSADWRHSVDPRRQFPQACSPHADRDRRRLWRHRHQPALRDAGVLLRLALGARHARQRARRPVADHLFPAAGHLGQVHRDRDARRQPGRRRDPGADGADPAAAPGTRLVGARAVGDIRRRAALRRRHDHAGDHRARRHRRPQGRDAAVRSLCRAGGRRHPDRRVRDSAARHPSGRASCSGRSW